LLKVSCSHLISSSVTTAPSPAYPDSLDLNSTFPEWPRRGARMMLTMTTPGQAGLLSGLEPDLRRACGEDRYQAVCLIDGRLHVLAFTMRGRTLGVISLRKANAKERRRCEQGR
jgi:hypothetical protein